MEEGEQPYWAAQEERQLLAGRLRHYHHCQYLKERGAEPNEAAMARQGLRYLLLTSSCSPWKMICKSASPCDFDGNSYYSRGMGGES